MVIQTAVGWILDVSKDGDSNDIFLHIKLQNGKVINFKQELHEHIFYMLPKSYSAGEDLYQQLSRNDQLTKKIFWEEKYIDLSDKNKTRLIGISLVSTYSADKQDYKKFIQILARDSRVSALYNIELSELMQFIYTQLKIPPTSKVKIEYEAERLLSISSKNDGQEIAPPPFSTVYIEICSDGVNTDNDQNEPIKLIVRSDNQATTLVFNGLSDPSFISYITENSPDIIVFCGDYRKYCSILTSENSIFTRQTSQTVIIHSHNSISEIHLLKLIEKARFSFLPLKLASKYGMMRLIDSRTTYELLQRNFVIPRKKSISTHHEQIRTLEDIVEMDKAGMIISPEIGLNENVAVLDFDNEYANLIMNHNISYETAAQQYGSSNDNQMALLPSIMEEIVTRRIYLKKLLKEQPNPDNLLYSYCKIRLKTLKQILVCLYGTWAQSGTDIAMYASSKKSTDFRDKFC